MGSNLNKCGECIKANCKNCSYYIKPKKSTISWVRILREGLEGVAAGLGIVVLIYVAFIV